MNCPRCGWTVESYEFGVVVGYSPEVVAYPCGHIFDGSDEHWAEWERQIVLELGLELEEVEK